MITLITQSHTVADIETQINNGIAELVKGATLIQGYEGQINTSFYRLWGMVVRRVYDRSSTVCKFSFIKGDDKELFEAYYI